VFAPAAGARLGFARARGRFGAVAARARLAGARFEAVRFAGAPFAVRFCGLRRGELA
jgi:hypothetical protein